MLKGYSIISFVLMTDFILYFTNGISISGQIPDIVVFWTWAVMTPIVILRYFHQKWAKWLLKTVGLFMLLSLIPMGIPFLTIALFATGTDNERVVQNYTLREGAKSVLAIPKIRVVKSIGILEKEIGETDFNIEIEEKFYGLIDFDDINIIEEKDSLEIEFVIGNEIEKRKLRKE